MKELDYLKELISIKSFDLFENKEVIDYLYSKFVNEVEDIIMIKNDDNEKVNLLIGLNTKLKDVNDAVILSGHIDTVEAKEDEYSTDPYKAVIKHGKLYGLGSIDMKSFFACILANLTSLKTYGVPIVIAISSDEETDLCGVKKITQTMKELNIVPRLTIVGEPSNMDICIKGKSCLAYKIVVKGKSCHSSVPQNGVNANYVLARLVLLIERLSGKFKETTMTCNVISGGNADNIISDNAKMIFDLRTFNVRYVEKILSRIYREIYKLTRKYKGVEIKLENKLDILPFDNNAKKFIKLCKELEVKKKVFVGGCEAGYFQALGGSAIVCGVGELSLAHKPNEYVEIDELKLYFSKLCKIISFAENNNLS